MAEIRIYDGLDSVQNKLHAQNEKLMAEYADVKGPLSGIRRALIKRKMDKIGLDFDARSLELGKRKPSGYHG